MVPARGVHQAGCCRRHTPLRGGGQAVSARGVLQSSCWRRYAPLQGAWGQALPERELLQASLPRSRQRVLRLCPQ
jgi:hypothetical protein